MIISEDDIPTFSRLRQSLTPPLTAIPHPHPPILFLHICKHGPAFIRTYQSRSEQRGEGSHSPSGPSLTLSCRTVTKRWGENSQESEEKSLVSENTILQSMCLLAAGADEEKADGPSVVGRKSALSLRLNAWVPPALSVLAIPPLHPRSRRGTCKHIS